MSNAYQKYTDNIDRACRYLMAKNPIYADLVDPEEIRTQLLAVSVESKDRHTGVVKLVRTMAIKATYDHIKEAIPALKKDEIAGMMKIPFGVVANTVATREMERIKEEYDVEIGDFLTWEEPEPEPENEADQATDKAAIA